MKKIIIIGSSGHARVIIDAVEKEGEYNILGLLDPFRNIGEEEFGYKILGNLANIETIAKTYNLYGYIIAIGDNWTRYETYRQISSLSLQIEPINVIHPTATIGKNSKIGYGNVILANTTIGPNTEIGNFCIINNNTSIDHDSVMDNFSSLAPGVTIGGSVSISEFVAILIGTTIIHNVSIGKHSVIGASSLVLENIDSHILAFGSPSKPIKKRKLNDKYL